MKVTTLDEKSIRDIGHAFGYYDYEEETGMSVAFSGKEATANYICAYVRGVLRGGFLHTTSERGGASLQDRMDKEKKPTFSLDLSVCGNSIRGRAICERCWTLPLLRATGWACR